MQKALTKEEIAIRLDGIEYRDGIPGDIIEAAKANNLVILYGSSDDLIELRGAINEELSASSVVQLTRKGVPESDCGPRCAYYLRWLKKAVQNGTVREVRVFWGGDLYGSGDVALDEDVYAILDKPTWCFETNMPVSAFSMYDTYEGDREHFCRGIVLDLDQWFPARNYTQTVMCQGGCES